jgi:hypothetical protein
MTHQRPALDLLNDIGRGKLARELTEALHQLNTSCLETGKKGQLQLRLTVEPDKDAPRDRFRVSTDIHVKAPKLGVRPSLFYVTDEGNLTRTDPNQEAFEPLRGLDGDTADDTTTSTSSRKKAN